MIHECSVVLSEISGEDVDIGPFVYIARNVTIGRHVKIHPQVVIEEGVEIGDDVEIFPGAYIGKPPKGPALGSHTAYEKKLFIGQGCVIGPHAVLYYGDQIGAYTLIGDGASIRENVEIGERCIIGRNVTINYAAKLENRVKVMDLTHITAHTVIRNNAFVAPGVFSADDNRFGKDFSQSNTLVGGAEIGENANIGVGATLLPKVKIGKNAVVGAGAVVTHDVEDNTLVLGMPARKRN